MKQVFVIIHLCLLAWLSFLSVQVVHKKAVSDNFFLVEDNELSAFTGKPEKKNRDNLKNRRVYDPIEKRNLFEVLEKKRVERKFQASNNKKEIKETPVPDNFKLRLLGTVIGMKDVFAVIEDQKNKRKQFLVQSGDKIGDARVKAVQKQRVILSINGEDRVLEMKTQEKKFTPGQTTKNSGTPSQLKIELNRALIEDTFEDMENLTRQVKLRPQFVDGVPTGIMIYGIRSASVLRKIGLQNRDIIQGFNGEPVVIGFDVDGMYDVLRDAETINLTLLRRGKVKEIVYTFTE